MTRRLPLATSAEVAEYLNTSLRNLGQWAYLGTGPRYVRVGRERRYQWSDVDEWVAASGRTDGRGRVA